MKYQTGNSEIIIGTCCRKSFCTGDPSKMHSSSSFSSNLVGRHGHRAVLSSHEANSLLSTVNFAGWSQRREGAVLALSPVQGILEFGRLRGVRIIPEIDKPGHMCRIVGICIPGGCGMP